MCGIFCEVMHKQNARDYVKSSCEALERFADMLKSRGPDMFHEYVFVQESCKITFAASVLWMQGRNPSIQPLTDEKGNVFLWNGDNFKNALDRKASDTVELFKSLTTHGNPLEVLSKVHGPFAFIYLTGDKLYFGRDCVGRHSLLWAMDEIRKKLILTSTARRGLQQFNEVPAMGVFVVNLDAEGLEEVVLHPWSNISQDMIATIQQNSEIHFKISSVTVPSPIAPKVLKLQELPQWSSVLSIDPVIECASEKHRLLMEELLKQSDFKKNVLMLMSVLRKAVEVRVKTQPGLCKNCLHFNILSEKLSKVCCVAQVSQSDVRNLSTGVLKEHESNSDVSEVVTGFPAVVSTDDAVDMNKHSDACNHATVGILFSGGLDSAVLAALAHEFVPAGQPIDLLNVAFERTKGAQQPTCRKDRRKAVFKSEQQQPEFQVPDRMTGIKTLEELQRVLPERQWNFVEINVMRTELENKRKELISDLIYPLTSVLDDSLGCAVWFAARGKGHLKGSGEYCSTVRVLLLGMGADELLGGYARHRTAFRHRGWTGLQQELAMDLARISQRNLGRDDRVLSHHACQGRFPFLDEEVVSTITALQPWERCWPSENLPVGVGDKLLLRAVAWKLGLQNAATLPKRAFQFGSRIANPKEKASDKSLCLDDAT